MNEDASAGPGIYPQVTLLVTGLKWDFVLPITTFGAQQLNQFLAVHFSRSYSVGFSYDVLGTKNSTKKQDKQHPLTHQTSRLIIEGCQADEANFVALYVSHQIQLKVAFAFLNSIPACFIFCLGNWGVPLGTASSHLPWQWWTNPVVLCTCRQSGSHCACASSLRRHGSLYFTTR